jgi:hypothetical protein
MTTHVVGFNQPERRIDMLDILHSVGIKASSNEVYQALATREGAAAARKATIPSSCSAIKGWNEPVDRQLALRIES